MDSIPPQHKNDGFNCPHCSAFAHQLWYVPARQEPSRLGHAPEYKGLEYEATKCARCGRSSFWLDGTMVYPETIIGPPPNPDMPEEVLADFNEARGIAAKSPKGAAALLRLAIQRLVDGLEEGSADLNEKIKRLVKKGLPPQLQQALDSVRVIGANAVHPGKISFEDNPEIAKSLFVFVNVICDSMITKPQEIREYYQKLPENARGAIEQRDKQ